MDADDPPLPRTETSSQLLPVHARDLQLPVHTGLASGPLTRIFSLVAWPHPWPFPTLACSSEWDEVKQHDVLFLLTIRPPSGAEVAEMHAGGRKPNAAEKHGLVYVRGCEVRRGGGLGDEGEDAWALKSGLELWTHAHGRVGEKKGLCGTRQS